MPVVLIDPVSMSTDDSGLMSPCYLGWPLLSSYLTGLSHSSQEGTDFPHHQNKLNTCPVLFPNNHTQIHMCATKSIYNPLEAMVYCWLLHEKVGLLRNPFNSPSNTPAYLWPLTDPERNQQMNTTKLNFCYGVKSLPWPPDTWRNHTEAEGIQRFPSVWLKER